MKKYILIFCLFISIVSAFAQDKLFLPANKPKARNGFIITGSTNFELPGADMAKRFDWNYRVGFGLLYKTATNWLIGIKFDYISGDRIKDDSSMINIRDKYNTDFNGQYFEFINSQGTRVAIPTTERGYIIGLEAGKIININKLRPDNGIMVLTSFGVIQHFINIYDQDNAVPELRGNYLHGYDRLTDGYFVEQYLGYVYFSKSRLINFHLGIDALFGFTQTVNYQYDIMRTDNKQRLDILFGLRGGWYIPMFRRKSEDLLFE